MPIRILLSLVLCNVIWGAHSAIAKHVMESFLPFHVAWLRYTSALIFYFLILGFCKFFIVSSLSGVKKNNLTQKNFLWLIIAGAVSFFLSPLMQFQGLAISTATELTLLIALEPLIGALIAWIVLRERLKRIQYLSFFLALCGFFLLSKLDPTRLRETVSSINTGNFFMIVAIMAESTYTIISRKLSTSLSPMVIFGFSLLIG